MKKETWPGTILFFLFYLVMMAMAVWCCSGCSCREDAGSDAGVVKYHTAREMWERTERINERIDRAEAGEK
jgi:hypothetical protein